MGSSQGKTEPKKATYLRMDVMPKDENLNPILPEISIPPEFPFATGKEYGVQRGWNGYA